MKCATNFILILVRSPKIVIKCSMPFEMERAADAWAGFIRINNDLRYLGVRVTMI